MTIDGHEPPFGSGVIGRDYRESKPWWPEPAARPHEGAPNVVYIVLDDVGYAQVGCYGSDIDTPNIDRLAAGGLRYSNFHTTALCSPTRSCLLTGKQPPLQRHGGHRRAAPAASPATTARIPQEQRIPLRDAACATATPRTPSASGT